MLPPKKSFVCGIDNPNYPTLIIRRSTLIFLIEIVEVLTAIRIHNEIFEADEKPCDLHES